MVRLIRRHSRMGVAQKERGHPARASFYPIQPRPRKQATNKNHQHSSVPPDTRPTTARLPAIPWKEGFRWLSCNAACRSIIASIEPGSRSRFEVIVNNLNIPFALFVVIEYAHSNRWPPFLPACSHAETSH